MNDTDQTININLSIIKNYDWRDPDSISYLNIISRDRYFSTNKSTIITYYVYCNCWKLSNKIKKYKNNDNT